MNLSEAKAAIVAAIEADKSEVLSRVESFLFEQYVDFGKSELAEDLASVMVHGTGNLEDLEPEALADHILEDTLGLDAEASADDIKEAIDAFIEPEEPNA